jgi:hypothetical protein
MSYEPALKKAWKDLLKLNTSQNISVKFLDDEYTIELAKQKVFSSASNAPAKDFTAILILHYLAHKLKGLPPVVGEWLSFKELAGVEGYYPAFRKRVIEPIIRKYGNNPEFILEALKRLPGKKADQGDASIILEVFPEVEALVILWRGDEEFAPEANVLFDQSITQIFCTEDIVVLAGFIASQL